MDRAYITCGLLVFVELIKAVIILHVSPFLNEMGALGGGTIAQLLWWVTTPLWNGHIKVLALLKHIVCLFTVRLR